ncbi:hypothetical protein HDU98_010306, partial [Podochytrium sp. JEL0797]
VGNLAPLSGPNDPPLSGDRVDSGADVDPVSGSSPTSPIVAERSATIMPVAAAINYSLEEGFEKMLRGFGAGAKEFITIEHLKMKKFLYNYFAEFIQQFFVHFQDLIEKQKAWNAWLDSIQALPARDPPRLSRLTVDELQSLAYGTGDDFLKAKETEWNAWERKLINEIRGGDAGSILSLDPPPYLTTQDQAELKNLSFMIHCKGQSDTSFLSAAQRVWAESHPNDPTFAPSGQELNQLKTLSSLMVGIKGSEELGTLLREIVTDYAFQGIGFLLSLCPLIPSSVSCFISSAGKKLNESIAGKTKYLESFELLVHDSQTFMTVLFNAEKTLTEFTKSKATKTSQGKTATTRQVDLVSESASFVKLIRASVDRYGAEFDKCLQTLDKLNKKNLTSKRAWLKLGSAAVGPAPQTTTKSAQAPLSSFKRVWDWVDNRFKKEDPDVLGHNLAVVRNDIRDEIMVYIGVTSGKTFDAVREGFECLERQEDKIKELEDSETTLLLTNDGLRNRNNDLENKALRYDEKIKKLKNNKSKL